jgi:signal transduction histidine kinase
MRRASWGLRAISLAIVAAIASITAACNSEPDIPPLGATHLTQAEFATSAPGDLVSMPPKALGELPALTWTSVTLPHSLPRAIAPSAAGDDPRKMESITAWYRIDVPATNVPNEMTALYLPRWHTWGNLSIYGNGKLVYSSLEEGTFSSFNHPLLIRLPVEITASRTLQLMVRTDSVRQIGGAVSSLWVGPMMELRPMFESRRLLQNRVPQITSFIFLVLGVFALAFWARRRHETTQLLFFVLSILFYVRNLHYYIEDTRISEDWFQWGTVNSLGWLNVVVYLYATRLNGQRSTLLARVLAGAMITASILSLPFGWFHTTVALLSSITYLIFIGVSFCVTFVLSFASWRARSKECAGLAAILWLNLGLGVHDWLLQNWRIDIESVYLLPFGVVALFAMFLATELRRYLGALHANEKAGATLEARLADRERELSESYGKLRAIEQAQLLSEERQRLMREMHDGLGSALMSSLVAVERGQMEPGDIAQVLRECVDDLKLTIDSLEPVGDDLLILLATLRYRLEPRLEAAGIRLHWEIEPVPTLPWLNPGSALQILRMLQELLTNTLKHAGARSIRIATRVYVNGHGEEITISVSDDGAGFDIEAARNKGRGLRNLQRRAADIGGRIEIDSNPMGTTVLICLPIARSSSVLLGKNLPVETHPM